MENLKLYIKESFDELVNNVTWPTWAELFGHTRIVLITVALFSLIAFLLDSVANTALSYIYKL
jgi:preprotein translocase subunit SecE